MLHQFIIKMNHLSQDIANDISGPRQTLLAHGLYPSISTMEHLALFMEYHVFAVWDFMSLLKALQMRLTCVGVPWLPIGDARVRRLVNEIVLGEESDCMPAGPAISHFELYLQAMREVGADTTRIDTFIAGLRAGDPVSAALRSAAVPAPVAAFVQQTFGLIDHGQVHEIAAAFTYGREELIPQLFSQLVEQLQRRFPDRLGTLRYYLDRHIELDGDEHGELGRQMVELLCEDGQHKGREASAAAVVALRSRIALWDAIADAIMGEHKRAGQSSICHVEL